MELSRRQFVTAASAALASTLIPLAGAAEAARPNVLFIMTDQQRFDGMSAHGGAARTPNLDSLATRGADLRRFFAQAPVCVPSRCNLFTGRYSHSHGVRENNARLQQIGRASCRERV